MIVKRICTTCNENLTINEDNTCISCREIRMVESSMGKSIFVPGSERVMDSRDQFREAVLKRDEHQCVACTVTNEDAILSVHHLIERRLWSDGGYYINNGVTLCEPHHFQAEQTLLSVDTLRELADISKIILPDSLEQGNEYDKWGNVILPDGQRMIGPLFYDMSVQKILPNKIKELFQAGYVKYPRTPYVFWSPGADNDLSVDPDSIFYSQQSVVITEKMDGENTTLYRDHIHARSIESGYHSSRTWVKNFWASIAHDIPKGFRVCGENMYAKHSIKYENLDSYFLGFSVWNLHTCLKWDDTLDYFKLLGIPSVPILFYGKWSDISSGLSEIEKQVGDTSEGYVIRSANEFVQMNFQKNVAKFVRPNHVQTTQHWKQGGFEVNGIR